MTYGSWALIAGGSQGIGEAFALNLAKKGLNLVLIARRIEQLEKLAEVIKAKYGVEVKCISLDLAREDIVPKIQENRRPQNRRISIQCSNNTYW